MMNTGVKHCPIAYVKSMSIKGGMLLLEDTVLFGGAAENECVKAMNFEAG